MPRETISRKLREAVYKRDGNRCRYCGKTESKKHLDHVYPVFRGGETTLQNLVVACARCNVKKHILIGMWPKPIGYFDEKDIQDDKWIDVHFVLKYLSLSFLSISCLFMFLVPFGNVFILVYVGLVALASLFWITQHFFVDKNIKHRIVHK